MSENKIFKSYLSSIGLSGVIRRPVIRKMVRDFP